MLGNTFESINEFNEIDKEAHPNLYIFNQIMIGILIFALIIQVFPIYPCYSYVHTYNKFRDEETLVYPVLSRIHQNVQTFNQFVRFTVLGYSFICLLMNLSRHFIILIFPLIAVFFIVSALKTAILNILLTFLIFQRSALYLFPNFEYYLTPKVCGFFSRCFSYAGQNSENIFRSSIQKSEKYFCALVVLFVILTYYIPSKIDDSVYTFWINVLYLLPDFFLLISTAAYIFVFLRIREFRRQISVTSLTHNPETFILYQARIILMAKIFWPIIIGIFLIFDYSSFGSLINLGNELFFSINVATIPLIIELTYLTSNKKHWETLASFNFRSWNEWKIFFGFSSVCRISTAERYEDHQTEQHIKSTFVQEK